MHLIENNSDLLKPHFQSHMKSDNTNTVYPRV